MGMLTDARIAAWQKHAGLEVPPYGDLLTEISDRAFDLIKIIELEKSGIREGDGFWHGSDPFDCVIQDMKELFTQCEAARGPSPAAPVQSHKRS